MPTARIHDAVPQAQGGNMSEIKDKFILKAPYQPTGDQPQAIDALVQGVLAGDKCQSLLGVTGSG